MPKSVECTCGVVISAGDDDELVELVNTHARDVHEWPPMPREQVRHGFTVAGLERLKDVSWSALRRVPSRGPAGPPG